MKFAITTLLLWVLAGVNLSHAQTTGVANTDQKRKLVEQKIRLIDMLVNSPAARSATVGGDADSARLVSKGQQQFQAAKQALADNRLDEATKLLDEALRSASSASRKISSDGAGLSESAQRKSLADMTEQVATYRTSVVDLTRDSKVGLQAQQLLTRIDALSSESKQLADGGHLGDANKKMASAYKLTVEEITKLRAGQEVILSLNFETPLAEYEYEQKRFGSTMTMVDMMIGEGRAEGSKRPLIENYIAEGHKIKETAEAEASSQQHPKAVKLMENASRQLNRALQLMGVPVF